MWRTKRLFKCYCTDEVPFSVGDEACDVATVVAFRQLQVDATHVVRPRTKLHRTVLVVKREPGDVDLTGAQEQSGWHPEAVAVGRHHHVGRERTVDVLVRAAQRKTV